ncbi:MAG: hypothetical protein U0894_13170 [Pirellulales bacterium]
MIRPGTTGIASAFMDNGPGIVKKQIPLIRGKPFYGSKFHRLRMSRGQQGIGIEASGRYVRHAHYGQPVKIISSKTSPKKPSHYFEIQIDNAATIPKSSTARERETTSIPVRRD